ncbi:MAG: ChaN family lipoprotein [Planctomycetes bacterium]|nr:ChaN family lipoprotein [Planctomycetota bacterium]
MLGSRCTLLPVAVLAVFSAPALPQENGEGDLDVLLERHLEEGLAREKRNTLGELARALRERDPLAGLEPRRRRVLSRFARVLDSLPGDELVRTGVWTRGPATASLADVALRLGRSRAVLVGEEHDNPTHHEIELRVLALLHAADPKIAVGLEMLPRSAQGALDDFLALQSDEAEFLSRVDWQRTWGFDYAFYRPALDFARDHGLPVLALNAPADVTRRVSREGLSALTKEQRSRIAREIDTTVESHRRRFARMTGGHPGHGDPERMYEAMCVWDETMAETAAAFLASRPGWRIVVLAGNGHVEHGDGIPDRIRRRTGDSCLTVVPRAVEGDEAIDFEELLADPPGDYVFFTE